MTWHHPNYYKKIRAERKKIPVSGTRERETAPSEKYCCSQLEEWEKAPSLKLQAIKTEDLIDYKKFHKLMVTSLKDPSVKPPKSQAASDKPQAPSGKHQASSRKRQAP